MRGWLDRLGYTDADGTLLSRADGVGSRAYAAEISDMLAPDRGIAASCVYCVDDVPVVCFYNARPNASDPTQWLDDARSRLWNQGLVSVVIVIDAKELHAVSVLRPNEPPQTLPLTEAYRTGAWSASDFQTGQVQLRAPSWFEPDRRIDRRLLKNLSAAVAGLASKRLSRTDAEVLLAQVIFVRVLEERKIIGERYRDRYGIVSISQLINTADGAAIDNLLEKLGETFNGDFLDTTEVGAPKWSVLQRSDFQCIAGFLKGEHLPTKQMDFWGYDFSIIPVETISGIYESFLGERQKAQGAYYTPRHLAVIAVEQAFEGITVPHKLRVFDGACGSGILLTTAFQKMLATAETEQGGPLPFKARVALLENNIFGGDTDNTACWLTAFSLYLCLLERLTPADIERLQEDAGTRLPHLIVSSDAGAETRPNICSGPIEGNIFNLNGSGQYDIVLSNPPWKEPTGTARDEYESWLDFYEPDVVVPDGQIAAAFTHCAAHRLAPNGRMVLILPLNLLIGIDSHGFRRDLLERLRIERVVNLGDLRFLLFPNAVNACGLLTARPRVTVDGPIFEPGETILYLTPKADLSLALGRISVPLADQTRVPSATVYSHAPTLLHRYWGGRRDVDLLSRLVRYGTIESFVEGQVKTLPTRTYGSPTDEVDRKLLQSEDIWFVGKGFHATDRNNKTYNLNNPDWSDFAAQPFLATPALPRNHPFISADRELPCISDVFDQVATPGGQLQRLYSGPRVIWPNGLSTKKRIRASYTERPFAFQHTACALGGPDVNPRIARLLTIYLRSSLATYLLIMNSYSVVADRWAVSKHEIVTLPFIPPECHESPDVVTECFDRIDAIFEALEIAHSDDRDQIFKSQEAEVDEVISKFFGLTQDEQDLVRDAATYTAVALQPTTYSRLVTALNDRPTRCEAERYANVMLRRLNGWRDSRGGHGAFSIHAVIADRSSTFGAVRLSIAEDSDGLAKADASEGMVRQMIEAIARDLPGANHPAGLQLMPDIAIAVGDDIYIVKPMQRRFWLARAALDDADQLVANIDAIEMGTKISSLTKRSN